MIKKKEINKIIDSMTIKEKIGQINQPHYGWKLWKLTNGEYKLTDEFKNFIDEYGGVGSIYGLLRTDPWTGVGVNNGFRRGDQAKIVSLVQTYIANNTKLKIPALIAEECPHGHQSLYSESYPTNISIGSSFDLKTYSNIINEQRKLLIDKNINLALITGIDMPIDKRWGRTEECFSEDSYMAYRFNKTMVKTMQKTKNVGVTIKHFVAYGGSENGKNGLNVSIGIRELEEMHLKPFYGTLEEKVKSVMVAYNEIDGIPCIVNEWLLRTILRRKLKYKGMIMADGLSIDGLKTKWINDNLFVASSALNAGVDISLWDKTFLKLDECLKNKMVDIKTINLAVYNVLKLKNELGLLDYNYTPRKISEYYEDIECNIKMAASGSVLLKNNTLLPIISRNLKVLVIGDDIDDIYYQLGDYSSFRENDYTTYKHGLECAAKKLNWKITFENYNFQIDTRDFDLIIFFAGGNSKRDFTSTFYENGAIKSSKKSSMTSGEGVDLHTLDINSKQIESFQRIESTNILTILNMGKPMVITSLVHKSRAILNMWYPGNRGGTALERIILGEIEPSGRLSHTFPRYSGINNLRYNDKNILNYKYFDLKYDETLFEFGYGLGYGVPFKIEGKIIKTSLDSIDIKLHVENTNPQIRSEPILFFKRTRNSLITQRRCQLIYFDKIKLNPLESIDLNLTIELNNKYSLFNDPTCIYEENEFFVKRCDVEIKII